MQFGNKKIVGLDELHWFVGNQAKRAFQDTSDVELAAPTKQDRSTFRGANRHDGNRPIRGAPHYSPSSVGFPRETMAPYIVNQFRPVPITSRDGHDTWLLNA